MSAFADIISPGLQTTIQDAGRAGLRHLGAPLSGAADRLSLAMANSAAGNRWDAPALEATLTGPSLRFLKETVFALAGAPMPAMLNGTPVSFLTSLIAKPGDELSLGAAHLGARTYIAVAGGVLGESFLGSRSTYLPAMIGGVSGRALRNGDRLACAGEKPSPTASLPSSLAPPLGRDWVIRATKGPEFDAFPSTIGARFFERAFTVDRRADRMGARLTPPLDMDETPAQMKSSPVFPGTVQAPPDGAPLLMLPDAQTVGGYPRIAQIIAADLPLTGQVRPGDKIWFHRIEPEQARNITLQRTAYISSLIPGFTFT